MIPSYLKRSARYLLLDHFAGARGNVCSALVQKSICRTPTLSADAATGRQQGAVKRGRSREANKWAQQTGGDSARQAGEREEREGGRLHDPPFISPGRRVGQRPEATCRHPNSALPLNPGPALPCSWGRKCPHSHIWRDMARSPALNSRAVFWRLDEGRVGPASPFGAPPASCGSCC